MVTTQPSLLVHKVALDGCHHLMVSCRTQKHLSAVLWPSFYEEMLHGSDKTAIIATTTLLSPLVLNQKKKLEAEPKPTTSTAKCHTNNTLLPLIVLVNSKRTFSLLQHLEPVVTVVIV